MKNSMKRIAAIIALAAIAILIIAFVTSAFTAAPGESDSSFMALLFCIIAIPLLSWLIMFCIKKFKDR